MRAGAEAMVAGDHSLEYLSIQLIEIVPFEWLIYATNLVRQPFANFPEILGASGNASPFEDLPEELLISIFNFLDGISQHVLRR